MHLYSVGRKIYQKVKKNPVFANIIFLKEKYNQWFWSERLVDKVIFERKRREKIPFIIRRYAQDMGIGSYIISNLSQIDYAEKKGYKPVIDMKNYNGTVVDGHVENTWTLFFEQQEDNVSANRSIFVRRLLARRSISFRTVPSSCASSIPVYLRMMPGSASICLNMSRT